MADASQAELRNRILEKLFVLIAGETADAEDTTTVNKVIVSINEQLREKEIAYWSDDACPQAVLEDLAAYMACFLANDYMDATVAAAFRQDYLRISLNNLRELVANTKPVAEPTRAVFF